MAQGMRSVIGLFTWARLLKFWRRRDPGKISRLGRLSDARTILTSKPYCKNQQRCSPMKKTTTLLLLTPRHNLSPPLLKSQPPPPAPFPPRQLSSEELKIRACSLLPTREENGAAWPRKWLKAGTKHLRPSSRNTSKTPRKSQPRSTARTSQPPPVRIRPEMRSLPERR